MEQTFDENQFTIRGQAAHERVDERIDRVTRGVRVARGLTLWSDALGLRGRADLVEFRRSGPYPVEYKVGRRRGPHAELQLCAQALCLEEMLAVDVREGAIFHYAERRRYEVTFDADLRRRTVEVIEQVRGNLQAQRLPEAVNDARCPNCSLVNACLPSVVAERARLRGLAGALFRPLAEGGGQPGDEGDA